MDTRFIPCGKDVSAVPFGNEYMKKHAMVSQGKGPNRAARRIAKKLAKKAKRGQLL